MKKISLVDQRERTRSFFIAALLLFLVAAFDLIGFSDPMRSVGERLSLPFLELSIKTINFISTPYLRLRHSFKAAKKVQDLELKYAEASAKLSELEALKKENQALKEMLNNSDRDLSKVVITAPILSLANPAVGVGKNDGILEGQMVLSNDVLLGTIDRTYENYSLLTLLYQQNAKSILAVSETDVQGLVKGDGKQILFTEIPMDAVVEIGEKVVTVGQEGIKKSIFIGRVVAIKSEPSSLVKTAVLDQLISFHEAVLVEVK